MCLSFPGGAYWHASHLLGGPVSTLVPEIACFLTGDVWPPPRLEPMPSAPAATLGLRCGATACQTAGWRHEQPCVPWTPVARAACTTWHAMLHEVLDARRHLIHRICHLSKHVLFSIE